MSLSLLWVSLSLLWVSLSQLWLSFSDDCLWLSLPDDCLWLCDLLWWPLTFSDCLCPNSDCLRPYFDFLCPYSDCLQPSLIFNNLSRLSLSRIWLFPSLLLLSPTFSDFQQPSLTVCVPTLTVCVPTLTVCVPTPTVSVPTLTVSVPTLTVSFTSWLTPSLYGCLQPSPTVSVTILTVFISIFLAVFVPTYGLLKLFSSSQPSLLYDELWLSPSFILLSLVFSERGMDR